MSNHERALVFDMDGVMIDSEPLWRRAEVTCFGEVGLTLQESDCIQTTGLRIDEAVGYWFERHPWQGASVDEVAAKIIERMRETIHAQGEPMAGVFESIEAAQSLGWRLGLASSSPKVLIEAVLERFELTSCFEAVCSAEDEERGKPAPDVYLAAVRALALEPRDCVAIEDSANGVVSATAAGLRCIAIPEPDTRDDARFDRALWRFDRLTELPAALPAINSERNDPRGEEG